MWGIKALKPGVRLNIAKEPICLGQRDFPQVRRAIQAAVPGPEIVPGP